MKLQQNLTLSAIIVLMAALPAMASLSLKPLDSQLGISWDSDNSSPVQNANGTWFFSVLEPPASNDVFAFQAVGLLTGAAIVKDDDSGAGTTTPALNGIDNGNGIITWTSSFLPNAIAFKFGSDWYSVWTTDMATFNPMTGLWSETLTVGAAPQGSLSHTSAQIPEPGTIAVWGLLAVTGYFGMKKFQAMA